MQTLKLSSGPLKVLYGDPRDALENDFRSRNGGKIFRPPWHVWTFDPETQSTSHHVCFGTKARAFDIKAPPRGLEYNWLPLEVRERHIGHWLETTGAVELIVEPE